MGSPTSNAKKCGFFFATAALLVLLIAATTFGDWLILTPDSFGYLRGARSLWQSGELPATRLVLPPGLSVLIAPMMAAGDFPFVPIRILLIAGWIASSILTFIYYRRELPIAVAFGIALVIASSPAFAMQSNALLSELVFIPFVLAALLVVQTWRHSSATSWRGIVLAGGLSAASILIRTMGVALIPVAVGYLLANRRDRVGKRCLQAGVFVAIALGPQLLWSAREAQYSGGYGYSEILTQPRPGDPADAGLVELQWHRFLQFGPQRLETIFKSVLPNRLGWRMLQPPWVGRLSWPIGGALVLLVVWRWLRLRSPADAFALVLLAMLAIWPWDEGVRFVLPMLPMFAADVATAVVSIWRRTKRLEPDETKNATGFNSPHRVKLAAGLLAIVVIVQLAEAWVVFGDIDRRSAREKMRVDRMGLLADRFDESISEGADIACVVPNESAVKTFIIGAAYLARRDISRYVDVKNEDNFEPQEYGAYHILTDESLAKDVENSRVLLPASDEFDAAVIMIPPR